MQPEYGYLLATEQELNDLLYGKKAGRSLPWPGYSMGYPLPVGSTGVIWKKRSVSDVLRPLALISRDEDFKRLCGRFAQLRSDLSPLTSWCHLLSVKHFDSLQTPVREGDLADMEAAWTGLAIAEAQLLSEKPLRDLRFTGCLATETFAIARTRALWGDLADKDIASRFDAANRFLRQKYPSHSAETRTRKVRQALKPIWTTLSAVLVGGTQSHNSDFSELVTSLIALEAARSVRDPNEAEVFVRPLLSSIPEAEALVALPRLAPEQRLHLFDQFVSLHKNTKVHDSSFRQQGLALVAGYLTTIAAGGTPTLTLAENIASSLPEITGWAYVVGGIGERVTWTSGFDGLGRLVSRELMRPFRLDEPPTCDISLDEAFILVDPLLPDPLVHLRIKQSRVASMALYPGVNVSIPINGTAAQDLKAQPSQPPRHTETTKGIRDVGAILADVIWPHLRSRVEQSVRLAQDDDTYMPPYVRPRKQPPPSQLPLKKSKP